MEISRASPSSSISECGREHYRDTVGRRQLRPSDPLDILRENGTQLCLARVSHGDDHDTGEVGPGKGHMVMVSHGLTGKIPLHLATTRCTS